jgi:hypothetical protein
MPRRQLIALDLDGQKITNVGTPAAGTDAARKTDVDAMQPLDPTLSELANLGGVDQVPIGTGTSTYSQFTCTSQGRALLDDVDAGAMLTTLSAQTLNSNLTALGTPTAAADRVPYFTGATTAAVTPLTATGRTLVGGADAAAMRTTLSAQQSDPQLDAIAGITTAAADQLPYFTGTTTAATTLFSATGRTLVGGADAAAMRTTLGAQASDPDLTTIAGLTPTTNNFMQAKLGLWSSQTPAVVAGDLAGLAVTDALLPKNAYNATNTILAATTTINTPVAVPVGASTFVGRKAAGNIAAMTTTEAAALLTDLVPKSLFTANSMTYATTSATPVALTVGASTIVGRKATGDISAMTVAETKTVLAYTGTDVANSPGGNIAATTVQAAITELDSEKLNVSDTTAASRTVLDDSSVSAMIDTLFAGAQAGTNVRAVAALTTPDVSITRSKRVSAVYARANFR